MIVHSPLLTVERRGKRRREEADRQTDRQTDRQMERERERQFTGQHDDRVLKAADAIIIVLP